MGAGGASDHFQGFSIDVDDLRTAAERLVPQLVSGFRCRSVVGWLLHVAIEWADGGRDQA